MRSVAVRLRWLAVALCVALGAACTTTRIDESRVESAAVGSGEKVVVLGRRHNSEYETEPEFVRCVGRGVASTGAAVVPELEFMNSFYPWFEPRTAPMSLKRFEALLQMPAFATRMRELNLRYIVWVDGRTETVDKAGSISCAVGPGGAGCIGFGTWDDESKYEASVWDLRLSQSIATISTESAGTSYMPAVIVPVPIIARVRAAACEGLSAQLKKLFSPA
ncbi:MAG TPA: hypothetical protein PLW13_16390 [Pseudomonadales bacterium]|nr:hypothetical protein [Pseudomonadales bacterium]